MNIIKKGVAKINKCIKIMVINPYLQPQLELNPYKWGRLERITKR